MKNMNKKKSLLFIYLFLRGFFQGYGKIEIFFEVQLGVVLFIYIGYFFYVYFVDRSYDEDRGYFGNFFLGQSLLGDYFKGVSFLGYYSGVLNFIGFL